MKMVDLKKQSLLLALLVSIVILGNLPKSEAAIKAKSDKLKPAVATSSQPSIEKDLDSLANDSILIKKTKTTNPKNHIQIIQHQTTNRNLQLELNRNYDFINNKNNFSRATFS